MIVVWGDGRGGSPEPGVYAQHVLKCGSIDPTWSADGVLISSVGGNIVFPVVVSDGSGGAFVAWTVGDFASSGDIYAQHVLASGVADPLWPANGTGVSTAAGRQEFPKITSDGAHGAYLTWNDKRLGPGRDRVFVQHLLSSGVDPTWTVDGTPACPSVAGRQINPVICSDDAGGLIVAWADNRVPGTQAIYAQHMSATGALLWAAGGQPGCTAPGQRLFNGADFGSFFAIQSTDDQANAIVPDGAGGCFLSWTDYRSLATTNEDVYAQHLTASGTVAGGWNANGVLLCQDPGHQEAPFVLSDGAGGAIATWLEDLVPARPGLFAQHVTAAGTVGGPVDGLVIAAAGQLHIFAEGVSDGSGGAVFVWNDVRNGIDNDLFAQHVRTLPSFGVDPSWSAGGNPVSLALNDQIANAGGAVSDGVGGVIVAWDDARNFSATDSDIYAQEVLASGVLPVFAAGGHVRANCPSPGTGLVGVTVDAYQVGTGDLVGAGVTDAAGAYTISNLCWGSSYTLTDVTPLDYASLTNDLPANGCSGPVDFALQCRAATGAVQSMGFWKHQVGVATGGNGSAQVNATTLCSYLDLIAVHFNDNALNPVIVYQPPASGTCADKLQVARVLLDLQGNAAMIARARQQLMSLLLNVAAGYVSQTQVISADGATVSQAITYCDNVIDSPTGNYERAKSIADDVNNGVMVPAGWIPLTTAQIAYRRGMEGVSFRAMPGAGGAMRDFQFMTGARGPVSLRIFDVSGRLVAELYHGTMDAGPHSVSWNGRTSSGAGIAKGLYFARLQTPRESPTIKVLELSAAN